MSKRRHRDSAEYEIPKSELAATVDAVAAHISSCQLWIFAGIWSSLKEHGIDTKNEQFVQTVIAVLSVVAIQGGFAGFDKEAFLEALAMSAQHFAPLQSWREHTPGLAKMYDMGRAEMKSFRKGYKRKFNVVKG